MSKRVWHSGPPPHVGWWAASATKNLLIWRWWDGVSWSQFAEKGMSPERAAIFATRADKDAPYKSPIFWTNYYPKNARVPRIDPKKMK